MKSQFKKYIKSAHTPFEFLEILCKYQISLDEIDIFLKYNSEIDLEYISKIIDVYQLILEDVKLVIPFKCKRRSDAKKDESGFVSLLYWRIAALKKLKKELIFSSSIISQVLSNDISGISILDSKNAKSEYLYKNYVINISGPEIIVANIKLR